MAKRGPRPYSKSFTPKGEGRIYMLDRIPAGLWTAAKAKARQEHLSLRFVLLTLVQRWLAGEVAPVEAEQAGVE